MKASVLWDIVSRAKIESHEAAGLQSPAPASGEPAGKAMRSKSSLSTTLVVRQTRRSKSCCPFISIKRTEHYFFSLKVMVFLSVCFLLC